MSFGRCTQVPRWRKYDVLTAREAGRAALDEAKERLAGKIADAQTEVSVGTRLLEGQVPEELPRAADAARMLVLGRTSLHGVEKALAGSVATSVLRPVVRAGRLRAAVMARISRKSCRGRGDR